MLALIRLLRRHKYLLYMLSWRDITVKYKQSVMGFLWAILMPLLITSAGVLVKIALAQVTGGTVRFAAVLGVAVKSVPWAFFVSSIRSSTQCLSNNANLVTKIAFPRAVFPLSSVISQLFDAAIASTVVIAAWILSPVAITLQLAWVPLLIALLVIQVSGLALILSAANLFFRDVKYLVEVILTFAIFFTPVFYDTSMFGKRAWILMLNPVAPILEGLSNCIIQGHTPNLMWLAYSAGVSLLLGFAAPIMFQRLEPKFAESI